MNMFGYNVPRLIGWYIDNFKEKVRRFKLILGYIVEALKYPHDSVFEWNGAVVSKSAYIYHTTKMLWGWTMK